MAQAPELRDHRGVHLLVRVPEGDREDAPEEVEVVLTVQVLDVRALPFDQDRRLRVEVGDRGKEVVRVLLSNRLRVHGVRLLF